MSHSNEIVSFDGERGLITVQSGIGWNDLEFALNRIQERQRNAWCVNQRQTGLNMLTVGGTLAANAHGHGLILKPFVQDIESFRIITHDSKVLSCRRDENKELFALAIGGYGLFGVVSEVTVRLVPRIKLKRVVTLTSVENIESEVAASEGRGCRYAHFQTNIDDSSAGFLRDGFYCDYQTVDRDVPPSANADIKDDDWRDLVFSVHRDKGKAYENFSRFLQSTNGSVKWSDQWANSFYLPGYHQIIDKRMTSAVASSEVLCEFYVPMHSLPTFMEKARAPLPFVIT